MFSGGGYKLASLNVRCPGVLAQGAVEDAKVVQSSCQVPRGRLGLRNRQACGKRVPIEGPPVAGYEGLVNPKP